MGDDEASAIAHWGRDMGGGPGCQDEEIVLSDVFRETEKGMEKALRGLLEVEDILDTAAEGEVMFMTATGAEI